MNKLFSVLSELDNENSEDFVGACAAKYRNLIGVPRLVVKNNTKLKTKQVKILFARNESFFQDIDNKYCDLINEPNIEDFLDNIEYSVYFDVCRVSFLEKDELFDFMPNKFKKNFKLNQRSEEQKNFVLSNIKHLSGEKHVTTMIIFDKLNSVWLSKWDNPETYLDEYDDQLVNNIINA
jgi:hypothetical protein